MGIDLDTLMILTLVGMLLAIFSGVHIALALGATAMIGTYFIFEDLYMAASQVGGAAYELIRDHIFMTIPLFVLMGDFLSRSGAAGDLYICTIKMGAEFAVQPIGAEFRIAADVDDRLQKSGSVQIGAQACGVVGG